MLLLLPLPPALASPLKPLASRPQPPLACGPLMPARTSPPAHLLMVPQLTALPDPPANTPLISALLTLATPELLKPHAPTFPLSTERAETFANGRTANAKTLLTRLSSPQAPARLTLDIPMLGVDLPATHALAAATDTFWPSSSVF